MIAKEKTIIKKKNLKRLSLKWDPGKKKTRELMMTKLEMTALAILLIILHHRFCHY